MFNIPLSSCVNGLFLAWVLRRWESEAFCDGDGSWSTQPAAPEHEPSKGPSSRGTVCLESFTCLEHLPVRGREQAFRGQSGSRDQHFVSSHSVTGTRIAVLHLPLLPMRLGHLKPLLGCHFSPQRGGPGSTASNGGPGTDIQTD